MTYPYQVWDDDLIASLAGPLARGGGGAWMVAMLGPGIERLDIDVGDLYAALSDPREATGPALDLVGDVLREPRGGLSDREYRRILVAKRIAQNAVAYPRVWAGWNALAGTTSGRMHVLGSCSILLEAPTLEVPSMGFRRRAGRIVRQLIGAGYEANATLYLSGSTARYDDGAVGYDVGTYAISIYVEPA